MSKAIDCRCGGCQRGSSYIHNYLAISAEPSQEKKDDLFESAERALYRLLHAKRSMDPREWSELWRALEGAVYDYREEMASRTSRYDPKAHQAMYP